MNKKKKCSLSTYKINKLLHGQGACTEFSHSLFVSENSLARCALARSISDTSPTRAKIPYARAAHEVISTSAIA